MLADKDLHTSDVFVYLGRSLRSRGKNASDGDYSLGLLGAAGTTAAGGTWVYREGLATSIFLHLNVRPALETSGSNIIMISDMPCTPYTAH